MRSLLTRCLTLSATVALIAPPAPALAAEEPAWLARVNEVRTANGLAPAVAEPAWSAGIAAHLRYLRLTPPELRNGQYANAHTENPSSPWYTQEGDVAGRSSNLGGGRTDVEAIDVWLGAPFHAIGMLRPGLARVGFHRDPESGAAGQDVIRGLVNGAARTTPVVFPGPGQVTDLVRFRGESPNPLEPCGYSRAGLPLIALLPADPSPELRAELVLPDGTTANGPSAALCVVTAATWRSSDTVYGPTGEEILRSDRAVLIIPPKPLLAGEHRVRLVQPGLPDVTWSFRARRPPLAMTATLRRGDCGVAAPADPSAVRAEVLVDEDALLDAGSGTPRRTVVVEVAGQVLRSGGQDLTPEVTYLLPATVRADAAPRALPAGATPAVVRLLDAAGAELGRRDAELPACPSTPTVLSLSTPTASALEGQTADVGGVLEQLVGGQPLAGQAVLLQTRRVGATDWVDSGSAVTGLDGRVRFDVPADTEYRLSSSASPGGDAATSQTGLVRLRPSHAVPTLALDRDRIAFGEAVVVTVTGAPGARVDLYSRLFPSSDFTRIRTGLLLDSAGSTRVVTRPSHNLRLLARDPLVDGGSAQPLVQVAKAVTVAASRLGPRRYLLTGTARPAHPGQTVDLYRNSVLLRRALPVASAGRWQVSLLLPAGAAVYEVRSSATGYNLGTRAALRIVVG